MGVRDTAEIERIGLNNRMDRKEKQRGRSHGAFSNWETHEAIHRQHNRRKQKILSSFPHIKISVVYLKILGTSPNTARGAKLSIEDICVEQMLLNTLTLSST